MWRLIILLYFVATFASTSDLADLLYKQTRCYEDATVSECQNIERCKSTHRCARGIEEYYLRDARHEFYTQKFVGGERYPIALSNDFEDWKTGTSLWKITSANKTSRMKAKFGWDSFSFSILGALEFDDGFLLFNTESATVTGDYDYQGVFATTKAGTKVAVFNFATIYIGRNVKVRVIGRHPLALLSRSSLIVDADIRVQPGTLGGFPGGGYIGITNHNGPGSTNVQVFVQSLRIFATHVPEIQDITTSTTSDQSIAGHFVLYYPNGRNTDTKEHSIRIPFDATSSEMKYCIETAFSKVGIINVERDPLLQNPRVGRRWLITFLTAIGNVPQLTAVSKLTGLGSTVTTSTLQDGNEIAGTFRLQFQQNVTRNIQHNVTAEKLQHILKQDFDDIIDAKVVRTDPNTLCEQGATEYSTSHYSRYTDAISSGWNVDLWTVPNKLLEWNRLEQQRIIHGRSFSERICSSGPQAANGYMWNIQFWSQNLRNAQSLSADASASDWGSNEIMSINETNLTGIGAEATISNLLTFSLAFGGGGGGHASAGGASYPSVHTKLHLVTNFSYGNEDITDLLGGSGGGGGGHEPSQVFPIIQPTLGGHGGGAMLISAVNDIVIGSNAHVSANGGNGMAGAGGAGGGGAGGTIALISEAAIALYGLISSIGGHGGSGGDIGSFKGQMNSGGGGSGGRVTILAPFYGNYGSGKILTSGGAAQSASRSGGKGSLFIKVETEVGLIIDPTIGAAGTHKSLMMQGGDISDTVRSASNGPRYNLKPTRSIPTDIIASKTTINHPGRISYFVRIGRYQQDDLSSSSGAVFRVIAPSNLENIKKSLNEVEASKTLVAIAIVNGKFTHNANAIDIPRKIFNSKVISANRWYKVDIRLNWSAKTYSIHLNNVLRAKNIMFDALSFKGISLESYHNDLTVWWDEIYVGKNFDDGFECPWVEKTGEMEGEVSTSENIHLVIQSRPLRKQENKNFEAFDTTYHAMTHHESHLSRRENFQHDNGGLSPFNGEPHRHLFNDVHDTYEDSNSDSLTEIVDETEFLWVRGLAIDRSIVIPLQESAVQAKFYDTLPDTFYSSEYDTTIYWYSEVYNATTGVGFIGCCSSVVGEEWRNEGIMLHFENLTDPLGRSNNFANDSTKILIADRPKVLWNQIPPGEFVMWLHIDDSSKRLGLLGIATSLYPNGPFLFERCFYPDSPLESPGGQSINETYDQMIAIDLSPSVNSGENPPAYLIRTFYKTIEYWLPRPVMEPLWESVKKQSESPIGSQASANVDEITDFGLNYHRAFYHPGYDDPNDVYLQRWRMETEPWEVKCCDALIPDKCTSITSLPTTAVEVCPPGLVKKEILGQSQVKTSHIKSRYIDPSDPRHSYFRPQSVPSHTSWGFQVYNIKSWRGNYFDALSTNITYFLFQRYAGERRRQHIEADTTIQYTYPNKELTELTIKVNDLEIVDLMLGTLGVPISQKFREMHSAYDIALIDTNGDGKITSTEIDKVQSSQSEVQLSTNFKENLLQNFEKLKIDQINILDPDEDGLITYTEFCGWIGADPNLVFDRFDLDKNGYLDENELARLMWGLQLPRLDTAIILLDPNFDGRVYYPRFQELLLTMPDFIFENYDFDHSEDLSVKELQFMAIDLGDFAGELIPEFAIEARTTGPMVILEESKCISKLEYATWLRSHTSLVADARKALTVDNAVHGTGPDQLVGPMHVVELRRAKYIALSKLTDNYKDTSELLGEIEGQFEGSRSLLHFVQASFEIFGLQQASESLPASINHNHSAFRHFLSPEMLNERASYWNGRHWEGRPSAPPLFTYGIQCLNYAGMKDVKSTGYGDIHGCLPCSRKLDNLGPSISTYQSVLSNEGLCEPQKELDAYIKEFDQQISIQLQYQQSATFGPQGVQPHMSPCYNQSQLFPCDVHKVVDGGVADFHNRARERQSEWNLQWENHPNDVGSSTKIRADNSQKESLGPSFTERFHVRKRQPNISYLEDTVLTKHPDQMYDILGGGS